MTRAGVASIAAAPCVTIGLGLAAASAAAQDLPLWELGIGVTALHLPHYRGAAQAYNGALPLPFIVYRGDVLRADRDGARALLFESDRLDIDLSLFATPPTRSRDDDARTGMPDLAATLEVGPNVQVTLDQAPGWTLQLRVPVRAAVTLQSHPKWVGWVATPNLNLDLVHGPWNMGLHTGPVFGTRSFFAYFYDVSDAQATPTRPAYQTSGGYGGWQATWSMSRRFDAQWVGLFVRFDSIAGATFADSPLVGRRDNVAFGIAWAWSLLQSDKRVPDRDRQP